MKRDGLERIGDGDRRARVLVDDEESVAELVATALRYEGFQVEVAASGRSALTAATSFRPHLIVLDVMLPDLDGFEVQRRLVADRLRVPILFLTARNTTEAKVHGLTMGADDYVTKPFSLEELLARVHAVLRRSGQREEARRLEFADLEMDEDTHEVWRGGQAIVGIAAVAAHNRVFRRLPVTPSRGNRAPCRPDQTSRQIEPL